MLDADSAADPAPARFWDMSAVTGTADFRGSTGLALVETGAMTGFKDGLPDLFYTNWIAQENALHQSFRTPSGELEYRDRGRTVRLAEDALDVVGWGCAFVDLDLDGRQDLMIANGSTLERPDNRGELIADPLSIYWNDGQVFRNVTSRAGEAANRRWCARGLAAADFDNDGLPDLAIAVNRGQPLLLRNETVTSHHSLKVRFIGPSAACFGARLEVTIGDSRQTRWWSGDVSFLSTHAPEAIFGLGAATHADQLQVTWADGHVTTLAHVAAGIIRVVHPHDASP